MAFIASLVITGIGIGSVVVSDIMLHRTEERPVERKMRGVLINVWLIPLLVGILFVLGGLQLIVACCPG